MAVGRGLVLFALALLVGGTAFGDEGTFARTLATDGPVELSIGDASTSRLHVSAGEAGQVLVRGRIHGFPRWGRGKVGDRVRALENDPPVEQDGNTIRIGVLPWTVRRHLSFSYDVVVPPGTNVAANGTEVVVEGLEGNLYASGSNVVASAMGGDVTVEWAESVKVENVAGDVKVTTNRESQIDISEVGGTVQVLGSDGRSHISVSEVRGAVQVLQGNLVSDWRRRGGDR